MDITENENREGDFFDGYFEEYLPSNIQNSATVKKQEQNNDKINGFFEDLKDNYIYSKSELNEENKKTKIKLKNIKKFENKAPLDFIKKKTFRKDSKEKKPKKKYSDLNHKTKTEVDYQIMKKNNPYNLDNIYDNYDEEEQYYNLYEDHKNNDEFLETLDNLDIKTNQDEHANTIQNKYNIPEELEMKITSNHN